MRHVQVLFRAYAGLILKRQVQLLAGGELHTRSSQQLQRAHAHGGRQLRCIRQHQMRMRK
ncbi:hypothetical protein EMGBS3_16100 [Anaerolineaceae bacterium]|nr:hypothetical protein EMGBS3_16100 [Anaerolineaceae bacterium]